MIFKKNLVALTTILGIGIIAGLFLILNPSLKLDSEINVFYFLNDTNIQIIAENFEKDFGVKVNINQFSSEGNMVEMLKEGDDNYDVIGVSGVHIRELAETGLIVPMNKKNVANIEYVDKRCFDLSYNSEKIYMAPLVWVTSGIAFNTKYIPENTDSWGVLWNPDYAGKIALMNNRNGVFMVALKYIGYPIIAQDRFQLIEAKKFLLRQKPFLHKGYEDQYTIAQELASGELWVSDLAGPPAGYAISRNPDIKYVVPKEGSLLATVGVAIPSTSKKKYTAEVFINYMLESKEVAAMSRAAFAAPCREDAKQFLDEEFLSGETVYPSENTLKNVESFSEYPVDEDILSEMENIWEELNNPQLGISLMARRF